MATIGLMASRSRKGKPPRRLSYRDVILVKVNSLWPSTARACLTTTTAGTVEQL